MRFFKAIVNSPNKIWVPLGIVLLNGVIHYIERRYLFADLLARSPMPIIVTEFSATVWALISWSVRGLVSWSLISVLLFYGGRLFSDGKMGFQNFFTMIGMCHLVLLASTLSHFIFTLINIPVDSTIEVPTTTVQLTMVLILLVGYICFAVSLVAAVQTFFQIGWVHAFCNVCVSYVIYRILRILSHALWYALFDADNFVLRAYPTDPIFP